MGDNLVALRKIQERPPRWGGPRMKTYRGDHRENFDDFADEIIYGCKKMGFRNDEEEKVRYLRGFLEGEAAEFLANMPNKAHLTLKDILKKMRERFKDSRTQSDFVYILTTRRYNPKSETVREYSHNLMKLVAKAYPDMSDDQRDQILKQKFLSTINSDLEKSVLNNKLAEATYQEIVDSVAKAEEFRKTKERCREKYDDDWFCNSMQKRSTNNDRYSDNKRGNSGYRPRNPYPEDRRCHYCDQVGHLQYKCPQT